MIENYNFTEIIKKVFLEEAVSSFRFLIDDYDFCRSKSEKWYILKYASSKVRLTVYNDPRCHELDVAVGLKGDKNKRTYDLNIVLEAIFGEGHDRDLGIPPDNIEGIRNQIVQLAELVRDNYKLFLEGDIESYKNLELVELKMGERGMRQYRQEVRVRAEKACKEKEYQIAVHLYESMKPHLTQTDFSNLKIARQETHSKEN